jgi:hypothetical protein
VYFFHPFRFIRIQNNEYDTILVNMFIFRCFCHFSVLYVFYFLKKRNIFYKKTRLLINILGRTKLFKFVEFVLKPFHCCRGISHFEDHFLLLSMYPGKQTNSLRNQYLTSFIFWSVEHLNVIVLKTIIHCMCVNYLSMSCIYGNWCAYCSKNKSLLSRKWACKYFISENHGKISLLLKVNSLEVRKNK